MWASHMNLWRVEVWRSGFPGRTKNRNKEISYPSDIFITNTFEGLREFCVEQNMQHDCTAFDLWRVRLQSTRAPTRCHCRLFCEGSFHVFIKALGFTCPHRTCLEWISWGAERCAVYCATLQQSFVWIWFALFFFLQVLACFQVCSIKPHCAPLPGHIIYLGVLFCCCLRAAWDLAPVWSCNQTGAVSLAMCLPRLVFYYRSFSFAALSS